MSAMSVVILMPLSSTTPATARSRKRWRSEIGDIELAVPRDRNGTFTPMLVPKGTRRLDGLDAMIVSLYAGGMTIRDIGHHLASTIGTELSLTRRSRRSPTLSVTRCWPGSDGPLEALYPVIYLDAIIVKVRDGGHVGNQAAHIAVGVDLDGDQACAGHLGPGHRGRQVLGVGVRRARQPRRQLMC